MHGAEAEAGYVEEAPCIVQTPTGKHVTKACPTRPRVLLSRYLPELPQLNYAPGGEQGNPTLTRGFPALPLDPLSFLPRSAVGACGAGGALPPQPLPGALPWTHLTPFCPCSTRPTRPTRSPNRCLRH